MSLQSINSFDSVEIKEYYIEATELVWGVCRRDSSGSWYIMVGHQVALTEEKAYHLWGEFAVPGSIREMWLPPDSQVQWHKGSYIGNVHKLPSGITKWYID